MANNIFIDLNTTGLDSVYKLIKKYPSEATRLLAQIGYESKSVLISQHLSGQDLRLSKLRDKKGRRTASYSFDLKNSTVKISSYPLNLFERGRTLRSGRREPAKNVFSGKLPGKVLRIVKRRAETMFNKLEKRSENV